MKLISVVIPVYNEENNVTCLVKELDEVFPDGYRYEYLFVDDGSTDNTLQVLKNLRTEHHRIRIISFTRNFGHQSAIYAGLQKAAGRAVITMDADFQDPPDLLPKFIEKWEAGTPVVLGRRKVRKEDSLFKNSSAKLYYFLLSITSKVNVPEHVGDFRLLDRKVVEVIANMPRKSAYLRGLIAWTGYRYDFVDYERPKRFTGKSKYSFSKMFTLALDGFFSLSGVPMRFGLVLGIASIVLGVFFLGYITYDTFVNQAAYPLYKWLVVILFMFTGFLFILMWVLAEYVERLYRECQDRPMYIVDQEIKDENTASH